MNNKNLNFSSQNLQLTQPYHQITQNNQTTQINPIIPMNPIQSHAQSQSQTHAQSQSQVGLNTNRELNDRSEIKEFFNYVNTQNNMNLKNIIFFYSKYSKLCEQFINSLHPNYKLILNMISVDNTIIRKRLINSKYKLQYVPCIFMLFENGTVNMHYGSELLSLVTFLNKNMETFMISRTNENLAKRKLESNGRTQLLLQDNLQQHSQKFETTKDLNSEHIDEILHSNQSMINSNKSMTPLQFNQMSKKLKESKNKMKNLPRVKEPVSEDFKRTIDVGISSRVMIPKGRKEHKKMARSSLTALESNKQLDTIDEENEETSDEEEEDTNIEVEDAEILDNILEDREDKTIDPILRKADKMKIKDIAAEMAKERGPVDDKPVY